MNGERGTPSASPIAGVGVGEAAAVALLAAAALAGLAVWVCGALAGLIFGAGAPHVTAAQLPRILAALPAHLPDPRAAWPAPARGDLPAAGAFYACAAVVVAVAVGLVAVALRLLARRRAGAGSARWAGRRDVGGLAVRGSAAGRVTLGRVGRRLVAAEPRHSVIALAPTQARKTSGLAIPAILEWDGPALVTSVKTDLVRHTLGHRQTVGDARVFDPVAVTGLPRAQWTPLGGCEDWHHAQTVAGRLAAAVQPGEQDNARFWSELGAVYLAPLLLAAARSFRTMSDVRRWVRQDNHPETFEEIHDALTGEQNSALADARATYERIVESDERMRSSLAATAMVALKAYGDPLVVECSQHPEVTADWLLQGPNTLYLCAPEDEQERLEPLFVTLVLEVVSAVYRQAAATGEPIDPPLLLLLDEVANIAAIPNLDRLASTAAGQGIQLVTIAQDLAQLRHRYGHDRARTIVNNHRARWIGAGTADPDTLEYVARLAGDEEIGQTSTSTTPGQPGRGQRTDSTTWRALAPQNLIREHAYGTGILIYGNLPPAQLTLRTWHDDPQLRHHALLPFDELAPTATPAGGRS